MGPGKVRQLEARDLEAVAGLERAVFSDPWSRQSFAELLELDAVRGFVVDDGLGGVAGYAVCSIAADEAEILNLAAAPALRRRGVGRLLLDAMVGWAAGCGATRVYLEVRRSNVAAIRMYEGAGFEALGVRRGYYRKPTEDAVTMGLVLGARSAEKR